MTMQTSDRIQYIGKTYYIIDISHGAKFIDPGDYSDPEDVPVIWNTACWRGYEVYLEIKDDELILKILNGKRMRKKLDFTGTMIMAADCSGHYNTDFLSSVLCFNDVKELVFEEGRLIKVNDLSDKLKDFLKKTKGPSLAFGEVDDYLTGLCVGKFGGGTYKWRSEEDTEEEDII